MNKLTVIYIITLTFAGVATVVYISQRNFQSDTGQKDNISVWCKNITVVHPKCQVFVKETNESEQYEVLPNKEYLLGEKCLENNIFFIAESADKIKLQCSAPYPIKLDYFYDPGVTLPNQEHNNLIETEENLQHHSLQLTLNTERNWTGKYIVTSLENEDITSNLVLTVGGDVLEKHERAKRYSKVENSNGYYYFYSELQPLVELIARRLLLADKVAVNKWDNKKPVEDLPREKIILKNVVNQAQAVDLSSRWAERFFRDQMDANKDIQNALIKMWEKNGKRPDGQAVDLASEIRPQIDVINHEMLKIAKATIRFRGTFNCTSELYKDARYITFLYSLDDLHQQALKKATGNVCK